MADESTTYQNRSTLERHVVSILVTVIFVLLSWNVYTTYTTSLQVATLTEKMINLQATVVTLVNNMNDRYTMSDAARDFEVVDGKIADLRERIIRLEGAE